MTADDYRRLALTLPGAVEQQHMGHPDFRVGGKIFATLRQTNDVGVLMLTPDQQMLLVESEPAIFRPVPGGWGRRGSTELDLTAADPTTMASALAMAWRNKAPKPLIADYDATMDAPG